MSEADGARCEGYDRGRLKITKHRNSILNSWYEQSWWGEVQRL